MLGAKNMIAYDFKSENLEFTRWDFQPETSRGLAGRLCGLSVFVGTVRLDPDAPRGELEADCPVLGRVIDLGPAGAVGVFDLLDALDVLDVAVAAEEDELWLAPEGEARGVAPPRPVVRSHNDIAIERFFRQQILKSWGLEIARQQ